MTCKFAPGVNMVCMCFNIATVPHFLPQPVPEELQNGDGFGYIIALRPLGEMTWTHIVTPVPGRYVYRNESIAPFFPFSVKVGAYNVKGQGPFSSVTTVFSAEEGKRRAVFKIDTIFGIINCNSGCSVHPQKIIQWLIQRVCQKMTSLCYSYIPLHGNFHPRTSNLCIATNAQLLSHENFLPLQAFLRGLSLINIIYRQLLDMTSYYYSHLYTSKE